MISKNHENYSNQKIFYDNLYSDSLTKIQNDNFRIDEQIDSDTDDRYGITLLFRPPVFIKNEIQKFLNELKKVEPSQYYYRNSDIHITIMSIISCYSGFNLDNIDINKYEKIISSSLKDARKFDIYFKGIAISQSGIMIQGFTKDETLNEIRNNLRVNFKNSNLEQSLDKRYSIQTAHSTVVRFRNKVKKKKEFIEYLKKFRDYDFGHFTINTLEFVVNDWYQKKEKVRLLRKFSLSD